MTACEEEAGGGRFFLWESNGRLAAIAVLAAPTFLLLTSRSWTPTCSSKSDGVTTQVYFFEQGPILMSPTPKASAQGG